MKKIILSTAIITALTTNLFASSVEDNRVMSGVKTTKEALSLMKKEMPALHTLFTDYYEAKTCTKNIEDVVSLEELQEFSTTEQYGTLVGLAYTKDNNPLANLNYVVMLGAFKYLNCGGKENLAKFLERNSTTAIDK